MYQPAYLSELIRDCLSDLGQLPDGFVVNIEMPAQAQFGDWSCNAAMLLAKTWKTSPKNIATQLVAKLQAKNLLYFEGITVAGPGFVNLFLNSQGKRAVLIDCLKQGKRYGFKAQEQDKRMLIEFVSANPTGPLHVGHARGAVLGDVLGNIMQATGWKVDREYYVNDHGRQMDVVVLSVLRIWAQQICGHDIKPLAGLYPGEHIEQIAKQVALASQLAQQISTIFAQLPDDTTALPENELTTLTDNLWQELGKLLGQEGLQSIKALTLKMVIQGIKEDLQTFGIAHNSWVNESDIVADEQWLTPYLAAMRAHNNPQGKVVEEIDGKLWFRSDYFGDDKPRVMIRDNGQGTYFASDVAYHAQKCERGYQVVMNIWGADHHGYIPRIQAALEACGHDPATLEVLLVQLVNLKRAGVAVSMSKRKGTYITLRELCQEVNPDAARVMFLTRAHSASLDFDFEAVASQNMDNPYYYLQYAHARISSTLDKTDIEPFDLDQAEIADHLVASSEVKLIRGLARWPQDLESAARNRQPHIILNALEALAGSFHSWYANERMLVENSELKAARLALASATQACLQAGMSILGITPLERLQSDALQQNAPD